MNAIVELTASAHVADVRGALAALGVWTRTLRDSSARTLILCGPGSVPLDLDAIAGLTGVAAVAQEPSPHPLLDAQAGRAIPITERLAIGPGAPQVLIAGPCGAESEALVHRAAAMAAAAGATLLRGGAFKPRTSPYAFAGEGVEALSWLRSAADAHGLALVTEALSERDVDAIAKVADIIQIGSRTMQAFGLLRAVGAAGKPVLLKRGRAATLAEWRLAAEHLLAAGAAGVIFCERGVMGADPELRNTLDLAGAAALALVDKQPVIVDPSHATGRRDLVVPLSRAALACGVHGVMVETHPEPALAKSDAAQALDSDGLAPLAELFACTPGVTA